MKMIKFGPNQPADRFYLGGERIAQFRAEEDIDTDEPSRLRVPEDWLGSITTLFGHESLGLTVLPDGRTLRDAILQAPEGWLGAQHVVRFGVDTGLLVKLLDAGERLPVHVHPDRAFARAHLGMVHGKTEAWIALTDGEVGLGFRRDVTERELADWVKQQNTAAMVGAMHTLRLRAGDAVLVPAGTPHAIGQGCFVVELQEPTDLSIMLEWEGFAFDGPSDGHLHLGYGVALQAVNRKYLEEDEVRALRQSTGETLGTLLPGAADYFRADRVVGGDKWCAGFAVVVVTAGRGALCGEGERLDVRRGETVVVPYAAGNVRLEGDCQVLLCRPPAVDPHE